MKSNQFDPITMVIMLMFIIEQKHTDIHLHVLNHLFLQKVELIFPKSMNHLLMML
jgi:hypothetical protein